VNTYDEFGKCLHADQDTVTYGGTYIHVCRTCGQHVGGGTIEKRAR